MQKIAILLILGLLTTLNSQPVVTAPNLIASPGAVVAPINVANFSNVGSFTLRIQFNPSVLTFVSVANWHSQCASALGGAQNGVVSLVWSETVPANISSGKLVDINFNYNGGNSPLTFVLSQCEITDNVGNPLSVTYNNGAIGVTPVELLSFESSVANGKVALKWITATETNNKGFEIHKAVEGLAWRSIGFIPGTGTTTEKQTYTFTDDQIGAKGEYQYRLIQFDYDGTSSIVGETSVDVSSLIDGYELLQNYPNPFNPTTTIKYSIPTDDFVSLGVFTPEGIQVAKLVNQNQRAGVHSVQFDASNLPSGVYFYKLATGNRSFVKKLMLLK